jgi:hypothetical protein
MDRFYTNMEGREEEVNTRHGPFVNVGSESISAVKDSPSRTHDRQLFFLL